MIQRPSFRGPNQTCSTNTYGRVLPMIDRRAVPAMPEKMPASNITIRARAAVLFDRRLNHMPTPTAAGIRLNPLAEPLMVAANHCQPFPLNIHRCERNQSSAQNKRPKIGSPIRAKAVSQCPTRYR